MGTIYCSGRHAVPEHEEKRRGNVWAPAHSPTMAGHLIVRNWLRDLELFGNYSWSHAIDTLSEGTTYDPRPKTPSSNKIIFQAGFLPSTGTSLRNSALTTLGSTSRFPSSWILIFKVWHLGRWEPGTELQNLDVWGNPWDCPLLTCWPHF